MNLLGILTLLAVVLVSGCATTSRPQCRVLEEEKIREMVLMESLALRDTNRLVFVSFQDSAGNAFDPLDVVMARIHEAGIPARKASEATKDSHTRVIDKGSGEPGVIYYAGVLKWVSNSKVEVVEGCTCASLGGGLTEYTMKKKDGKWMRTKTKRMVMF